MRGATTLTLGTPLVALMPIVGLIGTHPNCTPVDLRELGTHPIETFHFVSHLVDVSHLMNSLQNQSTEYSSGSSSKMIKVRYLISLAVLLVVILHILLRVVVPGELFI